MKSKFLFSLWILINFSLALNISTVIGIDLEYKASVGDLETFEVTKFQSPENNEEIVQVLADDGQRKNVTVKTGLKYTVQVSAINGSVPDQDAYCILKVGSITSREKLCSSTGLQSDEPTYIVPTVDNSSYWVEEADAISFEEISAKVSDDIFEVIYSFVDTDSDSTWEYMEIEQTNWKTGWVEYFYFSSKITYVDPGSSEMDSFNEIEIRRDSPTNQEESGRATFPVFFSLFAVISLSMVKFRKTR
ncbi:MAG: hypothetical protein ACW981_19095 [Candidatus Hodarchaeales archaeon]|jgi:hypothetical protein